MIKDYLVIGQGLAGSIFSYYLIKHNRSVMVFDDPSRSKSSRVAAGIFNPFTGRKMVKTWLADQLFPYLKKFYERLQDDIETDLLYSIPMYRPFLSIEEQNLWSAKSHEKGYAQYIDHIIPSEESLRQVVNPLGGLMLKNCGYLDIPELINGVKSFLSRQDSIRLEPFDEKKLELRHDCVLYKGITARKLIFCEGSAVINNKFFNWLPLRPVKGEILNIKLDQPLEFIVNRGVFVLPVEDGHCKVGATFDKNDMTLETTEQAKQLLVKKLDNLLRVSYRVTDQYAGIRPASVDRRPLIGLHPEFEPLGVFNGLGTKGVSLAPFFVQEFFDFLEEGRPLIGDVAINRHFSLYYNKI